MLFVDRGASRVLVNVKKKKKNKRLCDSTVDVFWQSVMLLEFQLPVHVTYSVGVTGSNNTAVANRQLIDIPHVPVSSV